MKDQITYNCEWCNKEHTQDIYNYRRYSVHFCGVTCALNYRWKENNTLKEEMIREVIECGCGCGELFNKYILHQGGLRERKYINGHCGNINNVGRFKKGNKSWNDGLKVGYNKNQADKIRGVKHSEEHRIKNSCGHRGISIEEFDGFTSDNDPRRNSKEKELHNKWRIQIFERDNYTCKLCGIRSGNGKRVDIVAHHIKYWSQYPELRRDLNNGVTLCRQCHYYVHSKNYNNELKNY